jgi:hypothetical protein
MILFRCNLGVLLCTECRTWSFKNSCRIIPVDDYSYRMINLVDGYSCRINIMLFRYTSMAKYYEE